MSNVIVTFLREPPRPVLLKGEAWVVTVIPMNKSGKQVALVATCQKDYREYTLCTGRSGSIRDTMAKGFLVPSGTPQRGIVTELRRAGIVKLTPHRIADEEGPGF